MPVRETGRELQVRQGSDLRQVQPSEGSGEVLHDGQGCLEALAYVSTALEEPLSLDPSVLPSGSRLRASYGAPTLSRSRCGWRSQSLNRSCSFTLPGTGGRFSGATRPGSPPSTPFLLLLLLPPHQELSSTGNNFVPADPRIWPGTPTPCSAQFCA